MNNNETTDHLSNIPFSNLIGGPLSAAVQAQAHAAETCIEFIEKIAFVENSQSGSTKFSRDVRTVDFKYKKTDGTTDKDFVLSVPILAIVPIPYIRVDEVLIEFNAKITQSKTQSDTSSSTGMWNYGASARWGWGRAHFYGSNSRKSDSTKNESSTQEYNMSVKVRAVQAEVPGGMQQILKILEEAIVPKEQTQTT